MGGDLHQLQQSLETLEIKAAQVAQEMYHLYQQYLAALGQSVAKQLLHSAYNLCTQAEPEAFLGLSLSEQQTLQQGLQRFSYQLHDSLRQSLQVTISIDTQQIDPNRLVLAGQQMEEEIVTALRQISREANHLLQDHQILNIKSMDTLFKIAAKADEAGRSITSPPHLLKALVEDEESEEEDSNVPVIAIYLQITDIELADPELMNWRHQLRQVNQKLMALNKEFGRKQQAQTTAKAEAAWRASWFPYDPDKDRWISTFNVQEQGSVESADDIEESDDQEHDNPEGSLDF